MANYNRALRCVTPDGFFMNADLCSLGAIVVSGGIDASTNINNFGKPRVEFVMGIN